MSSQFFLGFHTIYIDLGALLIGRANPAGSCLFTFRAREFHRSVKRNLARKPSMSPEYKHPWKCQLQTTEGNPLNTHRSAHLQPPDPGAALRGRLTVAGAR